VSAGAAPAGLTRAAVAHAVASPPAWARRAADALLAFTVISIPLSTSGMQIGVIALAALTVAAAVGRWGIVRRTPLDGTLALLVAALALSTLASGDPLRAGGWARLWISIGYPVFFWWIRDRAHAVRLARLLVLVAACVAAYGIVQHVTGIDVYRSALGRETEVLPRGPGHSGYAVVGFFSNYLTFAHLMLFPLAFAGALALRADRLGLVAAPLVAGVLILSTARGAWLAALAVAIALVLAARARPRLPALGAVAVAVALAFVLRPDLRDHAARMFLPSGENTGRVGIYRANLEIIHDHPVLGLGFGRYKRAAVPYYERNPDADRRSHAHSNYLQIAAEAGLVGLAAFALLWAHALRLGWTALARAPDAAVASTATGAWAALAGFLVGGITQYTFGDNEVALTMWVTVAILMRLVPTRDAGSA
jgi:O-antigen ligase